MAKTQNPSVLDPRFEKFTITSLMGFVDGYRDRDAALYYQSVKEVLEQDRTLLPCPY